MQKEKNAVPLALDVAAQKNLQHHYATFTLAKHGHWQLLELVTSDKVNTMVQNFSRLPSGVIKRGWLEIHSK